MPLLNKGIKKADKLWLFYIRRHDDNKSDFLPIYVSPNCDVNSTYVSTVCSPRLAGKTCLNQPCQGTFLSRTPVLERLTSSSSLTSAKPSVVMLRWTVNMSLKAREAAWRRTDEDRATGSDVGWRGRRLQLGLIQEMLLTSRYRVEKWGFYFISMITVYIHMH